MQNSKTTADYVPVTKTDTIREGRGKAFTVNGRRIAIFNENGTFYATDNTCPHAMGSLGRGRIRNCTIVCPVHGYAYHAETGHCQTDPRLAIRTYPIQVQGDQIAVSVTQHAED